MSKNNYSKKKMTGWGIRWKEPLGKPECPYAYRWVFYTPFFSIRLHHFVRSDDKRFYHDHPWWFITFVLKGFYIDVSDKGDDLLKTFSIRYRKRNHKHFVVVPEEVWTILLTGPVKQKFKFFDKDTLQEVSRDTYFKHFGHPPCDEQ